MSLRADLNIISQWIKPGSRVLDLGCGNGTLLSYLQDNLGVTGYGLEIDQDNIVECIRSGVNVIQRDLDAGLADYDDNSFDTVIMTQTLQAVTYPDKLLQEMLRVGREGIVTFPNFGHWKSRIQIAGGGRMPKTRSLPNEWYNTPNIHLCTVRDFEQLCRDLSIGISQREVVNHEHRKTLLSGMFPNLFGQIALYRCHQI